MGSQRHCRSKRTPGPDEFLDSVRSARAPLCFLFDVPMVVPIDDGLVHLQPLVITNALL
jgi:hypothetical protein